MARNHCKLATGLEKHLPLPILPVLRQRDIALFFSTFSTVLCLEKMAATNSTYIFIKWQKLDAFSFWRCN